VRRARAWFVRLRSCLGRDRGDAEFAAEIETHLQLHIDDNIRAGMSPVEARRAALLKFGSVEAVRDAHRDRRRLPIFDALARDVRFALRTIGRQPLFAVTAILTLALGIGANAAVFSIVDAILLRPLPYSDPEGLVRVDPPGQDFIQLGPQGFTVRPTILGSQALSAMALYSPGALNVGGDPAVRLRGAAITGNFFDVLGVAPAIGRAFDQDDIAGGERLAVISDRFWAERFQCAPAAIGETIVLDGRPFSIVGVMPPGVDYPEASDLWVPPNSGTQITGPIPLPTLIARLTRGVSPAQARDEMVRLTGLKAPRAAAIQVTGMRESLVAGVRPIALAVWIAAGLVLLVASINVANLLLARVAVRQREFSLRRALGASRAQLIRQILIEGAVLSALAAALAVPVALWTIQVALAILPATVHGAAGVSLDARALLLTLGVAAVTTVAFGAAPALSIRARGGGDILRTLPATNVPPFWRRFRSVLLVAECALAVAIVAGAVTQARTVAEGMTIEIGASGERAIAIELNPPRATYPNPERLRALHDGLIARLGEIPGVEAAGLTGTLPGRAPAVLLARAIGIHRGPVLPSERRQMALRLTASPEFFEAAGIPLLAGRKFRAGDGRGGPPVMLVNERYGRELGLTPQQLVGRRGLGDTRNPDDPGLEIIGVVGNVRLRLQEPFEPVVYLPIASDPGVFGSVFVIVKGRHDPRELLPAMRTVVGQLDPNLPVHSMQSFDDIRAAAVGEGRFGLATMAGFAVLATILASVGLYGVIGYLVQLRTREIGIRLAIGATPSALRRRILAEGMAHAVAGLVLGLGLVFAAARWASSQYLALSPPEPAALAWMTAGLLAVALAATWGPAARATRIDPAVTLRSE
jgi:putative ABC transport system permease protein